MTTQREGAIGRNPPRTTRRTPARGIRSGHREATGGTVRRDRAICGGFDVAGDDRLEHRHDGGGEPDFGVLLESILAHELRAPLRVTQGLANHLLIRHGPQLDGEAAELVTRIHGAVGRMNRLVDDLVAFSRASCRPLQRECCPMRALAHDVVAALALEVEGRIIEFRVGELPDADADPALVRQLLHHVASNAVKFTADPAVVEIGATGSGTGPPEYFVRDNGIGFDMRFADRIFGVCERLHTVDEYEGTGVGLAIARRIADRHGGRMWADSEPGRGATFWFTLER